MYEAKPWMCPSRQHVLGLVVRNGSGVRQLLLYRHAIPRPSSTLFGEGEYPTPDSSRKSENAFEEEEVEVEVMAMVEGYVADVRCDLCGEVRTWVPGEEVLRQLLDRVMASRKGANDE